MRIVFALVALLLLACPLAARAASSCPDILLGDSLAVGMGPYARAAGFQVVARNGIGLSWLRAQDPRCARRVVVVIGTNDLRGIDPFSAEAYPARLAAIMARWQTQQITWATPGCFPRDESLERGSEALDRVLARDPLVRVGGRRDYMRVHSGRVARCSYLSGDGIHPTGAGYRAWWANLSQAIGPAPDEDRYLEARSVPLTYTQDALPSARLVRSGRPARSVQQARSAARIRSAQQARSAVRTRSAQQVRSAAPARSMQQARTGRTARSMQQARADRSIRSMQQTRANRRTRSVQQARPPQLARTAPQARARRDSPYLGLPSPSRQMTSNPIRRT